MAGEKARVTQEMIERIESLAYEDSDVFLENYKKEFTEKLAKHHAQQEAYLKKRLDALKQQQQQDFEKHRAEIKWEVQSRIRKERVHLFESFRDKLRLRITDFLESDGYEVYIRKCLHQLPADEEVVLTIRQEDASLFTGYQTEFASFELGGFYAAFENRVFDFTLESRLESALQQFVTESHLWIQE